ncbi:MAG: HAD family phosphatase [Kiritimatiellae bacterium]|nr:HAD family phosphatase [Kiritimatiellia bacterium]
MVSKSATSNVEAEKPAWGLLMEVEATAVPARAESFAAAAAALKHEHVELTLPQFLRYGLHTTPARMTDSLARGLGVKDPARDRVCKAVEAALAEHFSKTTRMSPSLDKLLEACVAAGARVVFVSWQEQEAAQSLADRLGLTRWSPEVLSFAEVHHEFPGPDTYLRGLKKIGATPHRSVALVSCQASSHAALAAGMRYAVVPDEFTSFQDFSGADWIAESWKDLDPAALFAD